MQSASRRRPLRYYTDALRRRLVGWLLGRVYRNTEAALRRAGALDAARVRRILVCRPNHRLGNMLLVTPLVAELGRLLPEAKVDVVVGSPVGRDVFGRFANVARVVCLPQHMAHHPIDTVREVLRLRRERYDLSIDPVADSQSGRLLLAAVGAAQAIGTSMLSAYRADDVATDASAPAHFAQLPVYLLRDALGLAGSAGFPPLTLALSAAELRAGAAALDAVAGARSGTTIGIFASATGSKRHDAAWWGQFMAALRAQQPGCTIVEVASEHGARQLPGEVPHYSSRAIREVAAFIANTDCFVSADCGVMHLAAASGATTVGLFSVSDPQKYAPYGHRSRAVQTAGQSPEDAAQAVLAVIAERASVA